jgi:SnoaL-like domain
MAPCNGRRLYPGRAPFPARPPLRGIRLVALLLTALFALPATAAAQTEWNPAAAVSAYSAALNAHDLASALALFDEYGSATDTSGHHFEGQAGLTEFLMGSGFGSSTSHVTTVSLIVVANRAIWTYSCSCAAASTEVRMVMNHDKISVFAEMAPPAAPPRSPNAGDRLWLVGLGLVAAALAGGLLFGLRRGRSAAVPRRASQGRLLAALHAWRRGGLVGPG